MASTTLFITDGNHNNPQPNNKPQQLNFERFTAADHEQWFDDHLGNTEPHHQLTIDQLAIGGAALMPSEAINPAVIIQDMDNKGSVHQTSLQNNDKLLLLPKSGYKAHLPVYLQPSLSTPSMALSPRNNSLFRPAEKMLNINNPRMSTSATTHNNHNNNNNSNINNNNSSSNNNSSNNNTPTPLHYTRPTNRYPRRSARPDMNTINTNTSNSIPPHYIADRNIDWKANPGPSIPFMSAPVPAPPENRFLTGGGGGIQPQKNMDYFSLPKGYQSKGKNRHDSEPQWPPTNTPQKETQQAHIPTKPNDEVFKDWVNRSTKGFSADQGTQTAYDHDQDQDDKPNYNYKHNQNHDPEPPNNYNSYINNNSSNNNNKNDLPEQIYHSSESQLPHKDVEDIFHFTSHLDAHDAFLSLANLLSSMAPVENWSSIVSLDLSHQGLVSIMDLSDILPHLEYINISHNSIYTISGLPSSLQTIKAQANRLTDIDGFQLLPNLHQLDLCDNAISSFEGKVLHAENNKIYSCKPFQHIRSLTSLNLRSNVIKRLRFGETDLIELESLDLSYNRIESLDSIEGLPSLRLLNLDHNDIESVFIETPMDRLKILRLSFNRLKSFNGSLFPDLRTLYLDTNQIKRIVGLSCIPRLHSFSVRNQGGNVVDLNLYHLRGCRKVYLSGNPMRRLTDMADFFTLEYLELCSAQLEELPNTFARQMPNLAVVYLSSNFLTNIRPLRELRYLRKLVLLDNRISNLGDTVDDISVFHHLYYLDLRENPISQKFYPAVTATTKLKSQPKLIQYLAPEYDTTWGSRDDEFREKLPVHWRVRRDGYRASLIKYCKSLRTLDNMVIKDEERDNADAAIDNIREFSKDIKKALEENE
ncbi:hypothetical protein J3Q64DRAFT_1835178 [Phycomyces blakesleeanus]|uniref:Uncharacterized protein n=1 Tax=Phycomyces blakesleeanus TaxID=4837 RepID=A0ABR3B0B3_PHYBL